ncbi:MAG: YqiA/YcfP family alpha/beta fold hydrolase [Bryobacteraceae bacterium]
MRIVYLHGFASSPQSSKAQFLLNKFTERGIRFDIPELDEGNFEKLTVSGMLAVTGRAVGSEKVVLMGSSLGGFVAGLFADQHPELVDRVVLLAPALRFAERWRQRFTAEQLAEWKSRGWAPFFHYGHKREERLGYSFVEDAESYDHEPNFPQPALLFHGTDDPVVPAATSRDFAARHSNVRMVEYASGHELTDVLDPIWAETSAFLHQVV